MYLVDIEKSIMRILTTPLGSRVMEPTFGSLLYELIDKRVDEMWKLLFSKYIFESVKMWEPRVKLKKATPLVVGEKVTIQIEYEVVDTNEIVKLEILWKQ